MSGFHYKADFIKQDGKDIYYKFYPDFIDFEKVSGEFQIDAESWQFVIINRTEINGRDSIYCNEKPVSALTYKVQKFVEKNGKFPKEIFWVA